MIRKRLIAVGALEPVKNLLLILRAVVLSGRKDIEVVLVGRGSQEKRLAQFAAAKGVALRLAGTVPNDELSHYLREADVYLITSLHEGNPKSLLEAMSVGLPCIGTDVPGIRGIIAHCANGWLTQDDPFELADLIAVVLDNPSYARGIGQRARRYILEHYDARVVMAQEIAFLKEVAG